MFPLGVLRVVLCCQCIRLCYSLMLGLDHRNLPRGIPVWKAIVSQLYETRDLQTILRLMKTAGKEVTEAYYRECSFWSGDFFLLVRGFVLSHPQSAQLLLPPTCYVMLNRRIHEGHAHLVNQDFDTGLLGAYNGRLSLNDRALVSLKLDLSLEKFDPFAYLTLDFSNAVVTHILEPNMKLDFRVLFGPYATSALGTISDYYENINAPGSILIKYIEEIVHEEPSTVYLTLSKIFALNRLYPQNVFLQAIMGRLERYESQIRSSPTLFEKGAEGRVIYEVLRASGDYECCKGYESLRLKVQKIPFNSRSLSRFAYLLAMVSKDPLKKFRYFLGHEGTEKLYKSQGLFVYPRVRALISKEQLISSFRKWWTTSTDLKISNLMTPIEAADLIFQNPMTRLNSINSRDGAVFIRELIDTLIGMLNSNGREEVHVISGGENGSAIHFDINSLLGPNSDLFESIIKLVVFMNIHFNYDIVFHELMLKVLPKSPVLLRKQVILEYLLLANNSPAR